MFGEHYQNIWFQQDGAPPHYGIDCEIEGESGLEGEGQEGIERGRLVGGVEWMERDVEGGRKRDGGRGTWRDGETTTHPSQASWGQLGDGAAWLLYQLKNSFYKTFLGNPDLPLPVAVTTARRDTHLAGWTPPRPLSSRTWLPRAPHLDDDPTALH
ncbi:hypothetical protein J6590_085644 [Homalodisca vitripennis]|nr:hypothetical protein J6590_085644 [Homalodisca vitripennis]